MFSLPLFHTHRHRISSTYSPQCILLLHNWFLLGIFVYVEIMKNAQRLFFKLILKTLKRKFQIKGMLFYLVRSSRNLITCFHSYFIHKLHIVFHIIRSIDESYMNYFTRKKSFHSNRQCICKSLYVWRLITTSVYENKFPGIDESTNL